MNTTGRIIIVILGFLTSFLFVLYCPDPYFRMEFLGLFLMLTGMLFLNPYVLTKIYQGNINSFIGIMFIIGLLIELTGFCLSIWSFLNIVIHYH